MKSEVIKYNSCRDARASVFNVMLRKPGARASARIGLLRSDECTKLSVLFANI